MKPAIIAMDLDGTLLTTDKRLSDRNRTALERAAELGIFIVPVTGRIFSGLPPVIRSLPFLKYAIVANGASVYDVENDAAIYRADLTVNQAVSIMSWLDNHPVIYDCYMDDRGWMTKAMWEQIELYAPSPLVVDYMRSIRVPVSDLKSFLAEQNRPIQKVQVFCRDYETQQELLHHIPFQEIAVSSSVPRNVEINQKNANKGAALIALAEHLHIPRDAVMAFGDGLNDLSMIRDAGVGVAMGNAMKEIKEMADLITASNDEDGVAAVIEEILK